MDKNTKLCPDCNIEKPISEFFKKPFYSSRDGLSHGCKKCEYGRVQKQQARLKKKIFTILCNGIPKCSCCGELREEFLTLDHINGRTKENRKRTGIFALVDIDRLLKKGLPINDFRILCMNCNWSFGIHGYCPHETERKNFLQVA